MACCPYSKGQVTGFAAHCGNDKPVTACAGIFINSGCQPYTLFFCRVITKSWYSLRKGKVIVNGFGNMDILDIQFLSGKVFCEKIGRASCTEKFYI